MFQNIAMGMAIFAMLYMGYAVWKLAKRLRAATDRYETAEENWYELEQELADKEYERTLVGRQNKSLESRLWVTEQMHAASQRRADRLNDELTISQVFLELALDPDVSLGSVRAHELFGSR
jgi:hypothetical protein